MNRRDNNNLLESINRGNVNMNKEVIIARKLKIFSVDKEIIKEGRNPPTNRGNVNREKDKKINKI